MSALPVLKIADTITDPDKPFFTKGLIKDKSKIWGNNMVKAAKEYSQWAAPVLLTVLLGYSIYTSHQQSNSIDQLKTDLTILKTQKDDTEKYADKESLRIANLIDQIDRENGAHREQLNKEITRLQEALKFKQSN